MKIKRTEKRLIVAGAHPYFLANRVKWTRLNAGEVIEIAKDEYDSIKEVFGETIIAVINDRPNDNEGDE